MSRQLAHVNKSFSGLLRSPSQTPSKSVPGLKQAAGNSDDTRPRLPIQISTIIAALVRLQEWMDDPLSVSSKQ